MVISLSEINKLTDYMNEEGEDLFMESVEESDEYRDVVEEIKCDLSNYISGCVENAINVGFDKEIMMRDCNIPEEIVDVIKSYENIGIAINYN